jgi:serine/threonine-protein phosphatase 5
MNSIYGFQGEVNAKVDPMSFDLFTEAFNLLPLAACLSKKVLVVHGGLFSEDGVTLDQIRAIERNQQPPESGLMTEVRNTRTHSS